MDNGGAGHQQARTGTEDIHALVLWPSHRPQIFPSAAFDAANCRVTQAGRLDHAQTLCREIDPELVIMPLSMEGQSLLPYQKACMDLRPDRAIIIIAENDQINEAAEAMRNGAADCLFRPFSESRFERTLLSALGIRRRDMEGTSRPPAAKRWGHGSLHQAPPSQGAAIPPRHEPVVPDTAATRAVDPVIGHRGSSEADRLGDMVGRSPALRQIFARARAIAPSNAPVIIRGEVGTGRSEIARTLHDLRSGERPFLVIGPDGPQDISASTDPLHGSDIGADLSTDILAIVRSAEGGTLVIDRLDEFDPAFQMRLLPIVQRYTGQRHDPALRFIATLGPDPLAAVAAGRLREDLYYSLNVLELAMPPLRDVREDIATLADSWLPCIAATENRPVPILPAEVRMAFDTYGWPGNMRELQSVLRAAVLTSPDGVIGLDDLPARVTDVQARAHGGKEHRTPGTAAEGEMPDLGPLTGRTLADIERHVIEATIAAEGGSIPRAARVLGVSPSTIYRKRETWK